MSSRRAEARRSGEVLESVDVSECGEGMTMFEMD
jgi:hypothetical protein